MSRRNIQKRGRAKRQKKSRKSIVVVLSLCVIIVCAVMGIRYHSQQSEQNAENLLDEMHQIEIETMREESLRWKEVVDTDRIYPGIFAMGIDLGNCTVEQAAEKLESYYNEEVLSKKIVFTYDERQWEYTYADLGFTADISSIVEEAYGLYREGDIKTRYEGVRKLQNESVDLVLQDQYEETAVDVILEELREEVEVEGKNASLSRKNGKFIVDPETVGYFLDIEGVRTNLMEQLESGQDIEISLVVEEKKPEVTEELLSKVQDEIGIFSTSYNLYDTGRNRNLEVGCSKINGLVMMPGDSFNFNDTVSPVNAESGYMEASTIVDGEYVPGWGGGLCQVCTTLYNAVIRAELQVTERYAHSRQPGYVVNGQDAAMSIGGKNFQFVNTSAYPIYIEIYAYDGTLGCTVYGVEEHDASRKVSFESVKVGTIPKPEPKITKDETMDEGTEEVTYEGCEGLKYDVYKVVTEKGETTRTYFNSSTYYPVADKITVGTKPVEKPKEESDKESEEKTEETSEEESSQDTENVSERTET